MRSAVGVMLAMLAMPGWCASDRGSGLAFLQALDATAISGEAVEGKYSLRHDQLVDAILAKILRVADGGASMRALVVGPRKGGNPYPGGPCTSSDGTIYIPADWVLTLAGDEAAMAALLGHEAVHVVYRHHLQSIQTATTLRRLGSRLDETVLAVAKNEGERERMTNVLGRAMRSVVVLEGQEQEYNADLFGAIWILRAGYEYDGAVRLLRNIKEKYGDLAYGDEGMLSGVEGSDHPSCTERLARLEEGRAQILKTAGSFGSGAGELEAGDHRNAVITFTSILRFFPQSAAALGNLGCAYHLRFWEESGMEGPRASLLVESCLEPELIAKVGPPRARKGGAGGDLEMLVKAQQQYESAVAACPGDLQARNNLAMAHLDAGRPRRAYEILSGLRPSDEKARLVILRNLGLVGYRARADAASLDASCRGACRSAWVEYLKAKSDPEIERVLGEWGGGGG